MIQMYNTKFEDSAVICFWVILITDTHTDTQTDTHTDINTQAHTHTHTHTDTHTDTHTHRPNAKNKFFGFRGLYSV